MTETDFAAASAHGALSRRGFLRASAAAIGAVVPRRAGGGGCRTNWPQGHGNPARAKQQGVGRAACLLRQRHLRSRLPDRGQVRRERPHGESREARRARRCACDRPQGRRPRRRRHSALLASRSDSGSRAGEDSDPRRPRDRDAEAHAPLTRARASGRARKRARPRRPVPHGPPGSALLGADAGAALPVPRTAFDQWHRDASRRPLPRTPLRAPRRDRQRRVVWPAGDATVQAYTQATNHRLGEAGLGELRNRFARQLRLASLTEPLPDPRNRVTLAEERDALGIPRPKLNYRTGDYARAGLVAGRETHQRLFERSARPTSTTPTSPSAPATSWARAAWAPTRAHRSSTQS